MPGFVFLLLAREAGANPTGLSVVSGTATTQASGSQLNITVSQNAVLNWSSFNIAAGERTVFNQPSTTSLVVNQIGGQSPSLIYGSLQANGMVVLLNSSGFYFGPNSFVSAAGLTVSTANFAPPQNAGGSWVFNGPPPLASIVNYGQVKIGHGGDCFFIADKVENHGTVEADGGNIAFAAGQTVTLSERPDGRGMSMQVTLPQGSVDNYGNVIADGGTIAMNAKVVNQGGLIQANSVRDDHGVIELVASDSLNVDADSKIIADGDGSAGGSAGGKITLKSSGAFSDAVGSEIAITGGAQGGNGGAVEISAPSMAAVHSKIDGRARAGSTGGKLLLDPDYIVIDQTADSFDGKLHYNVNSDFIGLSDINLQAVYDISFADGITWDLSASTGSPSGQLTLEAGRNIIFGNTTLLTDANNWSVALYAGVTDFANKIVSPGAGSIYFNDFDPVNSQNVYDPSGSILLTGGSATLVAGQDIIVGTGRVITTGGGSISAHALSGNIDTGGYAQGYVYQTPDLGAPYTIDPSLSVGGISTAAGGDVTLIAGGNVQSILPAANGNAHFYYYDNTSQEGTSDAYLTAGAGAYGFVAGQAGNYTVIAGGNVTGHYLVANGTGKIYAGVMMDPDGNPMPDGSGNYKLGSTGSAGVDIDNPGRPSLALSLINGGWNVTAARNILLQEVRNPNGVFNTQDRTGAFFHAFDYGSSDYVNLAAGNQVQLGASVSLLPRFNSEDSVYVPVIYPGILNIAAGAGGVVLTGDSSSSSSSAQLILFPSPLGSLTINTTDGGSLASALPATQIFNLIMSDSGRTQYSLAGKDYFGLGDHATTPVHLGSEMPFVLNISGDVDNVLIGAPEAAQINVGGNLNNSRFQGMNLAANDTTAINVTGNIYNRGTFTTLDLATVSGAGVPDLSLLGRYIAGTADPSLATLLSAFSYNPETHTLTYQTIPRASLASILSLLQHLPVQVYVNGQPQWNDPPFNTVPTTTTASVLDSVTAQALLAKFNSLGTPPTGASGYAIGGGGKFDITAQNLDLGTTTGIQSWGVGLYNVAGNYPLAKLFTTGPDIVVNLAGNLNMLSSAISSLNGGNIYVNADGNLDVGSSDITVTSLGARGIYSTGQGNVSVYAGGDINVQGSRIAVYDTRPFDPHIITPGGALTAVSRHGNVIVGNGGSGFAVVNSFYVDPVSRQVTTQTPTIPGSGILQTSYNQTGNALVEALTGNVSIGVGGIKQVLFKGSQIVGGGQIEANTDDLVKLFQLALEGDQAAATAYQNLRNGIVPGGYVPFIDIYAGYALEKLDAGLNPVLDAFGNPAINAFNRGEGTLTKLADGENINATGSGIVGAGTANLKASGGIVGNIISFGDVNLDANKNINVNVFGLGTVSVASAGGSVSGTIIGVGGVNASGSSIDASLESNGTISGDTSGNSGFAASASAANVAAGIANDSNAKAAQATSENTDDELNKKKKGITLAQKVSRVTVILPKKN